MSGSGKGRFFRILLILAITVASVILVTILAAQAVLSTSLAGKIVDKVATNVLDADLSYGDISGNLLRFPRVSVKLEDVALTYSHDRFSDYDEGSLNDEGRGEQADTLASFALLKAGIDVLKLLDGEIDVKFLRCDTLKAYARMYDSTAANWNVFKTSGQKDTTSSSLPKINARNVSVSGDSRLVYADQLHGILGELGINTFRIDGKLSRADVKLDFDARARLSETMDFRVPLFFEGTAGCRLAQDSLSLMLRDCIFSVAGMPFEVNAFMRNTPSAIFTKGSVSVPGCPLGELIAEYGTAFYEKAGNIRTDAVLDFNLEFNGCYDKETGDLPDFDAVLKIPESRVEYADILKNGHIGCDISISNSADTGMVAKLSCLNANADGIDVSLKGMAENLLGGNPQLQAEASGDLELQKLMCYLPESLDAIRLAGKARLDAEADLTLNQIKTLDIRPGDVKARFRSPLLKFEDRKDSILVYMDGADIRLDQDRLSSGKNVLAAFAGMDSVNFSLGQSTFVKGRKLGVEARLLDEKIDLSSGILPFVGTIKGDGLVLKGADSLMVGLRDTDNSVYFESSEYNGRTIPKLAFASNNARAFLRASGNRIALTDISIAARGYRHDFDSLSFRRGPRPGGARGVRSDSLSLPDFLSESDFRKADIEFSIGESVSKFMREWQPKLDLKVGRGFVMTPSLPLVNTLSSLNAHADMDKVDISDLSVRSGASDIRLTGTLDGVRGIFTGEGRSPMRLKADAESSNIDLNEILAALKAGKDNAIGDDGTLSDEEYMQKVVVDSLGSGSESNSGSSLIIVPANLIADLTLDVGHLDLLSISADSLSSRIEMRERCLQLTDTRARTDAGSFSLDGFYSTKTKQKLFAGVDLYLNNVTAQKVIQLIPSIGEAVPALKSFNGNLDCNIAATTQIDTNMNVIVPSLTGLVKLNGSDLKIEDLGNLKKIAKLLLFYDKQGATIDDMEITGTISNNHLEVFPFVFGVDRYQLALSGAQNLNTDFDYHASILKSPLPFKLGVNVFGNDSDDFNYSIGKPRYNSAKVPVFDSEVDTLHINLVSSIKNIFGKGAADAVHQNGKAMAKLEKKLKSSEDYSVEDEMLSPEEQDRLDEYLIEKEIEQQQEEIERELDSILADFTVTIDETEDSSADRRRRKR